MSYRQFALLAGLLSLHPGIPVAAEPDRPPVNVTTTRLEKLLFIPEYSAPATTISLNDSRIDAETSGRILSVPVRVGDHIEQGQLLGELDCRSNRITQEKAGASVRSAQSRVAFAERQIKRSRSLKREQNISEELHNQRETDLETASEELAGLQSALEEARLEVERCRISAPFTGIVLERLAGEGEWISRGQPLVRLIDSERLEVSAQVSVGRLASLEAASTFELVTNQGRFPLTPRRFVAFVDSRGRNREVRLEFNGPQALPGTTGRLVWRADRGHVPADMPVRRNGRLGLILAEGDKARFLPLPHALEGQPVIVDLPADTLLVVEGRQTLKDGDTIRATEKEPSSRQP
jgi:RND family efflux transporter MFP subunit